MDDCVRLIDANAFRKWLDVHARDYGMTINNKITCMDFVKMQPTIDAVPVVRCMDCEYYDDHYCFANQHGAHEDGFCDEGRKKSG